MLIHVNNNNIPLQVRFKLIFIKFNFSENKKRTIFNRKIIRPHALLPIISGRHVYLKKF